jgi:hypothetical protein
MAELMLRSLPVGAYAMDDKERQTMRDHIIYLATQLEQTRKSNQQQIVFIKRLLDPEDLVEVYALPTTLHVSA